MIRVVIDTNLVVSANLNDDGLPAAILDLAAKKIILRCVSEAVLAEYRGVPVPASIFPDTASRDPWPSPEDRQPTRTITLINQDDPDNRLLECAHAAGARRSFRISPHIGMFTCRGGAGRPPAIP
jgi:hypothetical protein